MGRQWIGTLIVGLALVAVGCASGDDLSDSDGSDTPLVAGACLEGSPDCDDMVDTPNDGGGLPLAPPVDDVQEPVAHTDQVRTVDEALSLGSGDGIAVTGFVIVVDGEARICAAVAESYPPQCGGSSLTVDNPEALAGLPLVEEQSTQWLDDQVTLIGSVDSGVIVVSEVMTS